MCALYVSEQEVLLFYSRHTSSAFNSPSAFFSREVNFLILLSARNIDRINLYSLHIHTSNKRTQYTVCSAYTLLYTQASCHQKNFQHRTCTEGSCRDVTTLQPRIQANMYCTIQYVCKINQSINAQSDIRIPSNGDYSLEYK